MNKAELREQYLRYRDRYAAGELFNNEYALHLDTMLANYFGLPLTDIPDEAADIP